MNLRELGRDWKLTTLSSTPSSGMSYLPPPPYPTSFISTPLMDSTSPLRHHRDAMLCRFSQGGNDQVRFCEENINSFSFLSSQRAGRSSTSRHDLETGGGGSSGGSLQNKYEQKLNPLTIVSLIQPSSSLTFLLP